MFWVSDLKSIQYRVSMVQIWLKDTPRGEINDLRLFIVYFKIASMIQGCCEDACKNASNMHQVYFQHAKPYDCSLPSPDESLV